MDTCPFVFREASIDDIPVSVNKVSLLQLHQLICDLLQKIVDMHVKSWKETYIGIIDQVHILPCCVIRYRFNS